MHIELTEEQTMLRDSVAKFCKNELPSEKVRELSTIPEGFTAELWHKIAEQAWLGVLVPEDHGGLALGVTELGIILEEMGRALVPGPFFSCAAMAAPALRDGGSEALKRRWLRAIAAGDQKVTLALLEDDGQLGPSHVRAKAEKSGDGYILTGAKFFVPDLGSADAVIVAARTGAATEDITLFLVEAGAAGVSVQNNLLTDSTSRSGQLRLEGVLVPANAVVGKPGAGWALAERVLEIANVGLAAGSVAGAEQVLQTIVGYAKERAQFGVPIGTFQAVKHPLANMFAEIESARSAYHYAAWAVDARSPDVRTAVAVARMTATEAFKRAALVSLQAHGGIGFTWEYDLHLYLKRAMHNLYFLGTPKDYEEIVAEAALNP